VDIERTRLDRAAALATPQGVERGVGLRAVLHALGIAAQPLRCGRFTLLDKLGEGAMGTVYRARDPDLGRDVAIKVLREDGTLDDAPSPRSESASLRLRDEASALARLAHPNVVAALATGRDHDRTWIAMEFVPGTTLARWSEVTPPGPARFSRALAILRAAGEGLAAAHAVGLVHRDFKPANVLIGEGASERVCVADFGLARADGQDALPTDSGHAEVTRRGISTRTGGIVGTPRYMAPEQHRGARADARSDQFAFATSAWEVLTGAPPFPGRTVVEMVQNVASGSVDTRSAAQLPGRLRAVLRRGLAVEPAARFPSVPALLAAWDDALRPRRWLWAGWSVLAAAAIAGLAMTRPAACEGTGSRDAFARIWDEARRDDIAAAIRATAVPWARTAIEGIPTAVDAQRDAWMAHDIEACEATRSGSDPIASDRHAVCLARAIDVTDALLRRLEHATSQSAERALSAVHALPDPRACEEVDAVDAADEPLRRRLAEASAAMLAGEYLDALQLATSVADDAGVLGRAAIRSEAMAAAATAAIEIGGYDVEAMLAEAHAIAIAHDLGALAFDVATRGTATSANRSDLAAVRRWIGHAEAAARRAPSTAKREIELERVRCLGQQAEGKFERALATCTAALAQYEASGLDIQALHDRLRTSVSNLHDDVGNFDVALEMTIALRDEAERIHGPWHPRSGGMNLNVGTSALHTGDLELAEASILHAVEIFRVAYGERHRWVVSALLNLSSVRTRQKDHIGAELYAEAALEACGDRRDAVTARVLHNLAEARRNQGRATEALALLDRVALIEADVLPADHRQTAATHHTRGNALLDLGRLDQAATELEQAQRLLERHGIRDLEAIHASLDRLARARAAHEQGAEESDAFFRTPSRGDPLSIE
jgi:eukaryotic-like serine/threonine-protein kinase